MLRAVILFSSVAYVFAQACLSSSDPATWKVDGSSAVAITAPNLPGVYVPNTGGAVWISAQADGLLANPGTYVYETTFTLGHVAFSLGNYRIDGKIAVDDTAVVSLNGVDKLTIPAGAAGAEAYHVFTTLAITEDFLLGTNVLTVTVKNAGTGATNPSGMQLQITSACAAGDPIFMDLEGKRFNFPGEAGKNFHVFSDQFVSVNALFSPANPETGKGTVMSAIGVRWENHTLVFNAGDLSNPSPAVMLDGFMSARGNRDLYASRCVQITSVAGGLRFQTPRHSFEFVVHDDHNSHINTKYFDLDFSFKQPDPALCGGIMGQTGKPSTASAKFIAEDLLSTAGLTNKFSAQLMC